MGTYGGEKKRRWETQGYIFRFYSIDIAYYNLLNYVAVRQEMVQAQYRAMDNVISNNVPKKI